MDSVLDNLVGEMSSGATAVDSIDNARASSMALCSFSLSTFNVSFISHNSVSHPRRARLTRRLGSG